jgi:phosphotransferase system  glucose/maltose/N-acetylglucosamine-specific IIC component
MKLDKILHALAGAAAAFFCGGIAYVETHVLFAGLWPAITAGIIVAAIKEWCDYTYAKKWDWRDFFATIIGVVLAVLIILGLHYGKG